MNRLGLRPKDLQSKPAALCAVFLLVIYITRLKKSQLQSDLQPLAPDENDEKQKWQQRLEHDTKRIRSKDGNSQLQLRQSEQPRIGYTPACRIDLDYPKFAKPRRSFGNEISAVLSVLFPSYRSRAIRLLVLHMFMLGLRTYLSLIVADLDGRIVRHLIGANGPAFAAGLLEWLALAVPASYTNGMTKYLEGQISLEFRTTLVRYIHDLYVGNNKEYYKLTSIDGALQGVDHYITADVTKFSNAAAKLYSNLGKPTLDLFIFAFQLSRNLGRKPMALLFVNYFATAFILRTLSPAFGRLAARGAQLEGEYRSAHARVITNAEEIAFYDGAAIENQSLSSSYKALSSHIARVMKIKALYSVLEGYVLKYSWSASGFIFASVPVFFASQTASASKKLGIAQGTTTATATAVGGLKKKHEEYDNMGRFVTNKRIMLSISDAGGRIMYSIKDMAELAGYTRRVYQLIAALHRVRMNAYSRSPNDSKCGSSGGAVYDDGNNYTLADVHGKLEFTDKELVEFRKVPVIVPGSGAELTNGEKLIDSLTFEVLPGQHLLIVGSNGTGKSSIARLAAGLWPVYRGLLRRSKSVTFLPQRPYFSYGTLRDQIIYPAVAEEMVASGVTDQDLMEILRRVNLAYLPEREGGLDIVKEWKDVFSGGEKQRMLFARILYAKPKFAVIDEGTSAVSADMEGQLYEECKAQGTTLITISHRLSLLKYHQTKLEVGLGEDASQWTYENTSHEKGWKSMDKEIEDIKKFLAKVPELTQRREEVLELLKK